MAIYQFDQNKIFLRKVSNTSDDGTFTYPYNMSSDNEIDFTSSQDPYGLNDKYRIVLLTNDTLKIESRPEKSDNLDAYYQVRTYIAIPR